MSLTLYHSVESTCAQKVRIVLTKKKLEWEEIRLNLRKGEQFHPDYLRLNPKAVVPTLVHDGIAIRESTVINEYIEDRFPEPALRPSDMAARARMRLLIKTIDDEIHPAIGVLSYAIFLRHQMNDTMTAEQLQEHFRKVVDPARRERQQATHEKGLASPAVPVAISAMQRLVAQFADALDGRAWLVSNEFTLADAAAVPYMARAHALRLSPLWERNAPVSAWLDRAIDHVSALPLTDVLGSPGFHRMVSEHADRAEQELVPLLRA